MLDAIAKILMIPGDAIRQILLAIPMWGATGLFLFYFALLLVLVYSMKPEEMKGKLHLLGDNIDIRSIAAIAIIGQIILYLIF